MDWNWLKKHAAIIYPKLIHTLIHKKEKPMSKIPDGAFAFLTINEDGKKDFNIVRKNISAGDNEKADFVTDFYEAVSMIDEMVDDYKKVFLVQVRGVYEKEIKNHCG